MDETRYTKEHEWVRLQKGVALVGITDHAQQALGDIVYVGLPEPGSKIGAGEACAVVESVKAASDVYSPIAGHVSEINPALADDPALVNRDPLGAGWFFKLTQIDATGFATLLDEAAYAAFLETL
jgi:glycine cleavage system H protein